MSTNDNPLDSRRLLTPAMHLLFIGILFILPDVLMRMASPWRGPMSWIFYVKEAIMVGIFYLNYFVIIPRTLLGEHRNRWWRFIGTNVLIIAVGTIVMFYLSRVVHTPRRNHERDEWQIVLASISFILRDSLSLLMLISLAAMLRLSSWWVELERRKRELVTAKRESEIENLRAQLNPHFLFNTLNTIYALIAINPDEAQNAVHELSAMLRYVVYENPERVPVEREADFVRNYVDLMRLRLDKRPISYEVRGSGNALVPPLLLVTLVENAFKHGNTADRSRPIDIVLEYDDKEVKFSTSNYVDPHKPQHRSADGVGLSNLRRRIELIYGDRATIEASRTDNQFIAHLVIPSK